MVIKSFNTSSRPTILTKKRVSRSKRRKVVPQHLEIELRSINKIDARDSIHQFIKQNPYCRTSEIIEKLRLEPDLVVETLKELREQEFVLSRPV